VDAPFEENRQMSSLECADAGGEQYRLPREGPITAVKNRVLQTLARSLPGAFTFRLWAHRMRGVTIGARVHIAPDVIIETAYPEWVSIGNNVQLGTRCMILAHMHSLPPRRLLKGYVSVRIEDDVYIGPGAIVLPNVRIGRGAVVTAGSVVTRAVASAMLVQGNPAHPVARCGVALTWDTPLKTFYLNLKALGDAERCVNSDEALHDIAEKL
jgi:acetyltransferase-like isoleucine patch superfamily enzyme